MDLCYSQIVQCARRSTVTTVSCTMLTVVGPANANLHQVRAHSHQASVAASALTLIMTSIEFNGTVHIG